MVRLMRFLPRFVALTLLLSNALAAAERPNVIFILADDLGYGDIGCYGQKQIPTPHIDRLAAEGVRFTQFYAGSTVCAPSRNVLMTGQHTGHVTIRGNAKIPLTPADHTVAELFSRAGYATGLAGKWGLGAEGTDAIPTRKGFDFFFGYLDQTHAHNYFPTFLYRNEARVPLRNVVPNEGQYGLNAAIYSEDGRRARAIARQIRCGTVNINEGFGATFGSMAAPMGGMRQSGMGRRQGAEGILRYTDTQSVATQRGIRIGPSFGLSQEQFAKLMTVSLRVLNKIGRA